MTIKIERDGPVTTVILDWPEARNAVDRATAEELLHLPGIGPVLAQRIVDQRTSQGPFQTVDDLSDVKGIGKKRLDQLRPLVMVDMTGQAAKKTRQKAKKL